MKYLILSLLAFFITDPLKISKINSIKSEAKKAFQSGDYAKAVERYKYLSDSLDVKEDELMLNLAHAQYLLKDTANALANYQSLSQSANSKLSSKANQQLGLITHQQKKSEQALSYFKQAIRQDPSNEVARYNYEMLKKKLDEEKKKEDQQKKDQNKDKNDQNKNQEPSEYAKKLKEQADRLVAQRRYKEAYDLMTDGLKKDKTVSSYQKYIDRIKDVDTIYE